MQTPGPTAATPHKKQAAWRKPELKIMSIADITRAGAATGIDAPCNTGGVLGAC